MNMKEGLLVSLARPEPGLAEPAGLSLAGLGGGQARPAQVHARPVRAVWLARARSTRPVEGLSTSPILQFFYHPSGRVLCERECKRSAQGSARPAQGQARPVQSQARPAQG